MCCTSLRGVAFFGASVHIAVGFILFSRYVIATVVFTFYSFNNLFSERVTAFIAPFMVYVTLLLALGLLIFHSVEKESFFLLKWSSVAFSLLQLAVFVVILLLKLSPHYHYQQFPFLPESFISGYTNIPSNPAGPGIYITVPHGTTLEEKDIIRPSSKSPSSDPIDPGGTELTLNNSNIGINSRDGLLQEIYRLTILICCVLLTLVYLLFLFLYIRQLNYEDTGHVFGHAQAITRNIAFYVQPQFSSQQGNQDNNKGQVQRSQTQIPQQFLPQSPKKLNQLNQVQAQAQAPVTSSMDGSGSNPEVHRSPARQPRTSSQQSSLQGQNFSPKRHPHLPQSHLVTEGGSGGVCDTNPSASHSQPQSQVIGPGQSQVQGHSSSQIQGHGPIHGHGHIQSHIQNQSQNQGPNFQQQAPTPGGGPKGPIPAQVRIGFYPHDLRQDQHQQGQQGQHHLQHPHHPPHPPQGMGMGPSPQGMGPHHAQGMQEPGPHHPPHPPQGIGPHPHHPQGPHPQEPGPHHPPHPPQGMGPHHPPHPPQGMGIGPIHPNPNMRLHPGPFINETEVRGQFHEGPGPGPRPGPGPGPHPSGHHQLLQQRIQFQQHSSYPSDSSSSVAYSPNPPRDEDEGS